MGSVVRKEIRRKVGRYLPACFATVASCRATDGPEDAGALKPPAVIDQGRKNLPPAAATAEEVLRPARDRDGDAARLSGDKVDEEVPGRGQDGDVVSRPKSSATATWESAGVSLDAVKDALKEKRYQQAIADLKEVLKVNPRDCEALAWMGAAHAYSDQKNEASRYYRMFTESCPDDKRFRQVKSILEAFERSERGGKETRDSRR